MEPMQMPGTEMSGEIKTNINQMISNAIRDIKEIKDSITKKAKELKERLELNSSYSVVNEKYKEVSKDRKDVKAAVIKKDAEMSKLDDELRGLKSQKKDLDNALSDYLVELSDTKNHQMSFLDDDGNTVEFEMVAKIRSIRS